MVSLSLSLCSLSLILSFSLCLYLYSLSLLSALPASLSAFCPRAKVGLSFRGHAIIILLSKSESWWQVCVCECVSVRFVTCVQSFYILFFLSQSSMWPECVWPVCVYVCVCACVPLCCCQTGLEQWGCVAPGSLCFRVAGRTLISVAHAHISPLTSPTSSLLLQKICEHRWPVWP